MYSGARVRTSPSSVPETLFVTAAISPAAASAMSSDSRKALLSIPSARPSGACSSRSATRRETATVKPAVANAEKSV